ncbi:MAG: two-component system response regulator CreB [Rubritalea sp.]|jgi:two-component system catabolic regulation response regulator CreB
MPHILIVEDESSIAETIIYALETEHFQTTHVTTGAEAISLVEAKGIYSLVVLDIGLPDTSGLDVCQQIRRQSGIPILFLTARESEIDRILGLEFGADDYVTKPFSPRELVARIKAILRRTSNSSPRELNKHTKEGISINTAAMTVHCYGQPVDLTAHEYKLLATFISQPGRTFTREQLLEHAWEDPGSAMDRTVDAHIKTLRAKLTSASPQCAEVIQTRRGLGYCYHPPVL